MILLPRFIDLFISDYTASHFANISTFLRVWALSFTQIVPPFQMSIYLASTSFPVYSFSSHDFTFIEAQDFQLLPAYCREEDWCRLFDIDFDTALFDISIDCFLRHRRHAILTFTAIATLAPYEQPSDFAWRRIRRRAFHFAASLAP